MARRAKAEDPGAVVAAKRGRPGRPAGTRQPTRVETEDRVHQVQQLLASGVPAPEIVRWLTTEITAQQVAAAASAGRKLHLKAWKVSAPTARGYIRLALRGWAEEDREHVGRERSLSRRRFTLLYRRALETGDLNAALKAAEHLARMDNAYEPQVEAPAGADVDEEEAAELIDHAYETLQMARRRGVISPAQAASAIDVEPEPEPTGAPVSVVDETAVALAAVRPGGN